MNLKRPKVGIGIMVMKDGKVLMSKRKAKHGAGQFQFPGGHLEFNESFEECAERECLEEAGITINGIKFQFLANIKGIYKGKHYVHIGLKADWKNGIPQTMEPNKSTDWAWYSFDKLPTPLFEMVRLTFDSLKTGKTYYDS